MCIKSTNFNKNIKATTLFVVFLFVHSWEQRKLGELFSFRYGDGNTNPSNGGQYPVFGAGGIQGGYTEFNAENSIIIGHMGDAGCVSWGDGKHFVTYNGTITKPKNDIFSSKFGYYLLLSMDLRKYRGGSGLPFLTYEMLTEMWTQIPKEKDETRLIAECFTYLDNLITLHQRKVFSRFLQFSRQNKQSFLPISWEQRKLYDIADRFDNLRIPVAANLRIHGITPYYGANGIQDYVSGYTHDGEFVLVAEDGANDLKNYPVNYVKGRIWVNNHAHVLQGKAKLLDNKFLSYLINRADIESLLVGCGRAKLNAETMMNIVFLVPKYEEQIEIGNYLSKIDNLITLHQRECFYIYKKYLLFLELHNSIQMNYSWEQRKLGDIGTTFTGLSGKSKEDFGHGNAKFVTYMNVFSNPIASIEQCEKIEIDSKQSQVKYGDVFFTTSSETPEEVGMSSIWLGNQPNIYLNSFCFGYRPTIELDCYYLGFMLRSSSVRGNLILLAQGISRYNISKTKAMDIAIPVPNKDEQSKIGLFFSQLDNLITLHQCESCKKVVAVQSAFARRNLSKWADSWEQCKLGNVAAKVTEKNKQNRIKETFTNSAEMGVVSQRDFFDHDIAKADKIDGYYIVQENDFIYNPRISVTAPCGPINRNKLGRKGVMSPLYTIFRTNGINPLFLEWYFKSSCWYAYMYFNGDSGARSDRFSIKNELFFDMPIPLPKDDEQWRIGLLLESLNNLITLHQRKVFSKNIIFKNIKFGGLETKNNISWEQRKAKELCSISTGKSNTQDQVDDGKYPFYIRSDIPVRSNKYLYDCEAVITIGDGNIGRVFHYVNGKFDLHQRCYKMTDFQDIWGKYFFYYFSTKFYDRAMKMTAKATVDSVRLEMISEMDIKQPFQISEQKQIAEFFDYLNNLITLHQRIKIFITGDYHDQKNK